jgi:hypothetical protein
MRIILATAWLISVVSIATAQTTTKPGDTKDSEHSTGRTLSPDAQGQMQPQGWTGPLNTGTGGAPAESPQGQTPPNMQAAPEGSSKTIVDPPKN